MKQHFIMVLGRKVFIKKVMYQSYGALMQYSPKVGKIDMFDEHEILNHLLNNFKVGKIVDDESVNSLLGLLDLTQRMVTKSHVVIGEDKGKTYIHSIFHHDTFCMELVEGKGYVSVKPEKSAIKRILLVRDLMLD